MTGTATPPSKNYINVPQERFNTDPMSRAARLSSDALVSAPVFFSLLSSFCLFFYGTDGGNINATGCALIPMHDILCTFHKRLISGIRSHRKGTGSESFIREERFDIQWAELPAPRGARVKIAQRGVN